MGRSFMKEHAEHKFKRFKRIKLCYEYALFFYNSNDMIDYICSTKFQNIVNSRLYTDGNSYQLIITSTQALNKKSKYIMFQDKTHINEIKMNNRLICENNTILKIKKAFKEI